MTKKRLFVFAVLAIVASSAFALPDFSISAGIGGLFDIRLSQQIWFEDVEESDYAYELRTINGGGYAFFDATYVELSIGISGGRLLQPAEYFGSESSSVNLNIGVLGKFPFGISERFTLFPLLGFNYSVALSIKTDGYEDNKPGDFSEFWFQIGAGMDFSFTSSIYLRFTPLLGSRLPTKFEKDLMYEYDGETDVVPAVSLTARLAVGFRF